MSEQVEVYRGRLYHPDGSFSPVERWVRAADGDWISLDSERRTSRDIVLEPEGCACTELCEMGPTCPGGMLAGLPGSGCVRRGVCLCPEENECDCARPVGEVCLTWLDDTSVTPPGSGH